MKRDCVCVPNCDEVNYVIEHKDSREWFLGSNLQWGLIEYPRMRLKRDVLFGFSDVLGTFLTQFYLNYFTKIYTFDICIF